MDTLSKFKQKRVVQWGIAYLAGAWLILQVANTLSEPWNVPGNVERGLSIVLVIGFFVSLTVAWYHGDRGKQHVSGPELLILAMLFVLCGAVD